MLDDWRVVSATKNPLARGKGLLQDCVLLVASMAPVLHPGLAGR